MGKVYTGDVGTRIILDCGIDVSAATTKQIKYRKPNGDEGVWDAASVGGEDTQIYYDVEANDIDQVGLWLFQAYIEMAGWSGHGEQAPLIVYELFTR